jgi:hypothetical protein
MTEAEERARDRVEQDPALAEYAYVLLDDPLLLGLTKYESGLSDTEELELHRHFTWLAAADRFDVLEWAAFTAQEWREFLEERLEVLQEEVSLLLIKKDDRELQSINHTLASAGRALPGNTAAAAGLILQATRRLEMFANKYHKVRKLEPLAAIGERIRAGGQKGHATRYGSPEEKESRRAQYQAYLEKVRAECPAMSLTQARAVTAKHFNVSLRTMEKYT